MCSLDLCPGTSGDLVSLRDITASRRVWAAFSKRGSSIVVFVDSLSRPFHNKSAVVASTLIPSFFGTSTTTFTSPRVGFTLIVPLF